MSTDYNKNQALGFYYALKQQSEGEWITIAVQRQFGDFYASGYGKQFWAQSDAWKAFKASRAGR